MTVKELRDILKNFDDDLTVITKKTDFFDGNVGFVNSIRKDSFHFMFLDMPCVLITDEPQTERGEQMTEERNKEIKEWLDKHCRNCANNDDRGTEFVNCQAECEVQKDVGIACIHYEEYVAESED